MKKPKLCINAPVILGFVSVCVLVFLLARYTDGMTTDTFFSVYRTDPFDPFDAASYVRIFFHVFGYDSQNDLIEHLMMILLIGPMIEEKHSSQKMLLVIVMVALFTSIVHIILFPGVYLLGANGVIYALIIMSSFTGDHDGSIPVTAIVVAVVYLGRLVLRGYHSMDSVYVMAYVVESMIGGIIGFVMSLGK